MENKIVKGVTTEPETPKENYPYSHVNVELTDETVDECFMVEVHGVKHYLHANTVQHLTMMLIDGLIKWEHTHDTKLPGWEYMTDVLEKIYKEKC